MNNVFNRVYWMAVAGVVLIAATLLSGAALSEADEARAIKAGKVIQVPAHQLPPMDPQRIVLAASGDTVHVQLEPGTQRLHLTVVDSAGAASRPRVVIDHPRQKGHAVISPAGANQARPSQLE